MTQLLSTRENWGKEECRSLLSHWFPFPFLKWAISLVGIQEPRFLSSCYLVIPYGIALAYWSNLCPAKSRLQLDSGTEKRISPRQEISFRASDRAVKHFTSIPVPMARPSHMATLATRCGKSLHPLKGVGNDKKGVRVIWQRSHLKDFRKSGISVESPVEAAIPSHHIYRKREDD